MSDGERRWRAMKNERESEIHTSKFAKVSLTRVNLGLESLQFFDSLRERGRERETERDSERSEKNI